MSSNPMNLMVLGARQVVPLNLPTKGPGLADVATSCGSGDIDARDHERQRLAILAQKQKEQSNGQTP